MNKLELNTIIARGAEHVETRMSGQTVMMSLPRGKYFALEGTGQRIWECLAEPVSVRQIVEHMLSEYDVERARCETEVMLFVEELMKQGLTVEHGT